MDTRDAYIVDAFAPAPLGGTPVGLLVDGTALGPDQTVRMAAELGRPETVVMDATANPATLQTADPGAAEPGPHAAVAAAHVLAERGRFDGDGIKLTVGAQDRRVFRDDDGVTWVELPAPECRLAEASEADLAAALGLDPAALRDVAADLPPTRASMGTGVLAVPVNFLEHLGRIDPQPDALATILEAEGAETLYAFTFDTLEAESDVHGLSLERAGRRSPTIGAAEACAAAAIEQFGALDADRSTVGFESGDRVDRPARLSVRLGDPYAVGGPCTTALDGVMVVPPASPDDDIVEA